MNPVSPSIENFVQKLRDTTDGETLTPSDFGVKDWNFLTDQTLQLRHTTLTRFPRGIKFKAVHLQDCLELTSLPESLQELYHLEIIKSPKLNELPANLKVTHRCTLRNLKELSQLSPKLNPHVLSIIGCQKIKELPTYPDMTTLIVSKGNYRFDISKLPITEVMMENPEDNTDITTIPISDYIRFNAQSPTNGYTGKSLEYGYTEVELA